MYHQIFNSNSSLNLELSDKLVSQIHRNINKPLDGAYLADFGIDITLELIQGEEMEIALGQFLS